MMYTQLCNGAEFVLWSGELLHIEADNTISEIANILTNIDAQSSLSRRNVAVAIRHINSLPLNLLTPL